MIATQPDFKTVANAAFISLPSATQQGYERDSGIYIPAPQKRQEEAAAVVGTVVACRDSIYLERLDEKRTKIPVKVYPGEKVAVDYRVTSEGHQAEYGFVHVNCWMINEQLVWKTKPESLIAAFRDGAWQALGDYVILEKIVRENYQDATILIPECSKESELKGRATLISGLDLPAGTEILFDHSKSSVYQFSSTEEYIIVNRSFVLGHIS